MKAQLEALWFVFVSFELSYKTGAIRIKSRQLQAFMNEPRQTYKIFLNLF